MGGEGAKRKQGWGRKKRAQNKGINLVVTHQQRKKKPEFL